MTASRVFGLALLNPRFAGPLISGWQAVSICEGLMQWPLGVRARSASVAVELGCSPVLITLGLFVFTAEPLVTRTRAGGRPFKPPVSRFFTTTQVGPSLDCWPSGPPSWLLSVLPLLGAASTTVVWCYVEAFATECSRVRCRTVICPREELTRLRLFTASLAGTWTLPSAVR